MTFCATALDFLPYRTASESARYHIYVLGREAHARLIQEQLEKLLARLDELTRKQEALLDAGKQLKQTPSEKLAANSGTGVTGSRLLV